MFNGKPDFYSTEEYTKMVEEVDVDKGDIRLCEWEIKFIADMIDNPPDMVIQK